MSNDLKRPTAVVIGSGAAGIAAANTMLEHGVPVTLVNDWTKSAVHENLASAALHDDVAVRSDAIVWGLFHGNQVGLLVDGQVESLCPAVVVLDSTPIERSVVFPGWTSPGVMSSTDTRALLRSGKSLEGKHIVVAGIGQGLYTLASDITDAGGVVIAIVDGGSAESSVSSVSATNGSNAGTASASDSPSWLKNLGVDVIAGRVTRADPDQERGVVRVRVSPTAEQGRVLPDQATVLEVDTLCLEYGMVASTTLARMVNCDCDFDPLRGGWYVTHDEAMRSSESGVYVVGPVAGFGDGRRDKLSGALAGLAAAFDLGRLQEDEFTRRLGELEAELDHLPLAKHPSDVTCSFDPGQAHVFTPDTIVCPCEQLNVARVDAAIEQGARTLNDVKRFTRFGMGRCQGGICSQVLTPYLVETCGLRPHDIGHFTARPPLAPIPLRALAEYEGGATMVE